MVLPRAGAADSDSKSARTRVRILDAAAEVLGARGYASTRLSEVAEKADVQTPALYYYFASRDELVEEVLHTGVVQIREHLTASLDALPDGISTLERLSVAVEEHLRHQLAQPSYAAAAIRNAAQVPEAIRQRIAAEQRSYGEIWASLLRSAQEAGELREGTDLHMAQMLVLGALNWTGEWSDPQRGNIEALVSNAKAFVLNGLT